MISMDRAIERRIKRANTDWWLNEKAIVGTNSMTYIAYITDMGELHIKEIDAKCSRNISRDVCLCRINCNYADEHNAPSICILENGKILVMYTGHAKNKVMYYRITEKPYDITSFGPEQTIAFNGYATYAQISENTKRKELWLFNRVDGVTWQFRYSKDEAKTWSEPYTFISSDAGGLFYFDVHKQLIASPNGTYEQWFFALYGHPKISKDHTIRSGIFTADGDLTQPDGTPLGINLFESNTPINLPDLSVVYDSPAGTTVRLLSVAPTLPLRVGYCTFTLDDADSAVYHSATYKNGKWCSSAPIAKAGEFLAPGQTDGSQTYIAGMAYYYGVGEAGYHVNDGGWSDTNRIFLVRTDAKNRFLESYVTHDCGETYTLEQTLRTIPKSTNIKIWRPYVPVFAQDNLPVYWHEGTYNAHTGGWHCDVVMYVEYDD